VADSNEQQPAFEDLNTLDELGLGGPADAAPAAEGTADSTLSEAAPLDLSESGELPEGVAQADSGLPSGLGLGDLVPGAAAAAAVAGSDAVPDVAGVAQEAESVEARAEEPEKTAQTWLGYVEWVGVALAITAIYLVFSILPGTVDNVLWHAGYWSLMVLVPYIVWKTRKYWQTPEITAPYTVMMAIALMALFTAVFFLGLELNQYGWDLKAKKKDFESRAPAAAPSDTGRIS
jgi:hypothetical protein